MQQSLPDHPGCLILSVVVPVYNEAKVIGELHRRLRRVMDDIGESWEVIYVNDGSNDTTLHEIEALQASESLFDCGRGIGAI